MPFPSNQSAARPNVADAYQAMINSAGAIRARSAALSAQCAASPVDVGVLVSYLRDIAVHNDAIVKRVSRAGVQNYARSQLNDNTLVLATEFAAASTAINAVIAWFVSNLNQNSAGFLQYEKLAADGTITLRKMTVAELAPLVLLLDAVVVAID